jgi:SAM-dependent methyltransferase
MGFASVLSYAHQLVKERAHSGDRVIDATVGNGNDTLFLAELVGRRGIVYGFDIQQAAVENTRARIIAAGHRMEHIRLVLDSHAHMARHIPPEEHGRIAAVMFNLGYLPGADPSVITQAPSTIEALEAALGLLRPRGIITAVLYPGHEGGDAEAAAVEAWAGKLAKDTAQVLSYRFINGNPRSPYLIAIEKR